MQRIVVLILFLAFSYSGANATHNRAGEITYTHVSGLTYEVTITTCTRTSSPADREWLEIIWGDNTGIDSVRRVSILDLSPLDAQVNIYIAQHTFAGPGIFSLTVEDPNRNADIENIPNSVNQTFCVQSVIIISPFLDSNNSVLLLNPAKADACVGSKWIHNPGAVDIDGDSLVYSLVDCLGELCEPIAGYTLPDVLGGGVISINSQTGDVCWDAPMFIGEYNIAILIQEFRNGYFVGSVIRDMQITVQTCTNTPPTLALLTDTCIEAGDTLKLDVTATDNNSGQIIALNSFGLPYLNVNPPTFTGTPAQNTVTYVFDWKTTCSNVNGAPYTIYFKAEDNGNSTSSDPDLSDITHMQVTVVAPAPLNPTATPSGNSIVLAWDQSACSNATGYKIYRHQGPTGYVAPYCEVGVPAATGYVLIGTTTGWTTSTFIDNTSLVHGEEYCYMVVACFVNNGNAVSYPSVEFCTRLNKDVPIITRVDVNETDLATGQDTIKWFNPTELNDTTQWQGPYHYKVYGGAGFNNAFNLLFTTPTSNNIALTQDFYAHPNHNTETTPNSYRIDLYGNDLAGDEQLVGSTNNASSIFLSIAPNDNQNGLSWTYQVPWQNDSFQVYRFNDGTLFWDYIGSSLTSTYVDSGLINGVEYCYYVRAYGKYADPDLPRPLINDSQEECSSPIDRTPPCPPVLDVEGSCGLLQNAIEWSNPNNSCSDDAIQYNLYYTAIDSGEYVLLQSFYSEFDTTYLHEQENGSIAGCYVVTAIDTFGNESLYSNEVCVDNCPEYILPNVFSPNGDGFNDFFVPFPYRHVEDINMEIYTRWGNIVFKTSDPDISWDGISQQSNEPLLDGVYYYICIVNTITLQGIEPVVLKGYVQLFNDAKPDFK
jgi:gliding motility-associated-like protein